MNTEKLKNAVDWVKNNRLAVSVTAPLLIFLVCFLSFGIPLANLGLFQDDWHHAYYAYHEGAEGLKNFFFTDSRPFAYLLYQISFAVLGFAPAHWHWALMILRFLTALTFWLIFQNLWPDRKNLGLWLALYFVIHPAFTLQPLSLAYHVHWVSYLSLALSFFLMILATQKRKRRLLFTGLALVLQSLHLLMMEYYVGLELVRPIFLWMALSSIPLKQRIKKVFLAWLPYLLVLALYVFYRLSYNVLFGYDRFESPLQQWSGNALTTLLIGFLQNVLKDSIYTVVSPWAAAIDPSAFDLTRPSTWFILMGSLLLASFVYLILNVVRDEKESGTPNNTAFQLFFWGAAVTFLALLPSWAANFQIFAKNPLWSSRLMLPALLGASMLTVGAVLFFIHDFRRSNLFLAILLGIAFSFHLQTAREFKASWTKQFQFYWQLHWRAPSIQPGTLIVSDGEFLPYMGDTPTAYAINLMYPKTSRPPETDYWFAPVWGITPEPFFQNQPVEFSKYSSTFFASSQKVISVSFEPEQGQCLWILRPSYREVRSFSEETYHWAEFSNLMLISDQAEAALPAAIFGEEPVHAWCYYYEKADLAAQAQDWEAVLHLWEAAQTQGYRPSAGVELLPFIEAQARLSNWDQAQSLTLQANTLPPRMPSLLCTLWKSFEQDYSDQTAQNIILETQDRLQCQR